jgi:outer membrane protein TolC
VVSLAVGRDASDESALTPREPLAPLLAESLARNPEIAAARSRWWAERASISEAGSLADPRLMLGLDDQPFDEFGAGTREIGLTQELPFPGKRARRTSEMRARADAAREDVLETARVIATEVKLAYFELYMLDAVLAAQRESRRALDDLIEVTRTRYEAGIAGQQDLLLARVEASRLDAEILHAEALAIAGRTKLNLAIGRDAATSLGAARVDSLSPFSETLETLLARAPSTRAAYRARVRATEAEEAALSSARVAHRPDLELGAAYMQRPDADDEWRAEIGIPLPLWRGRKQGALARAAAHRVESARAELVAEGNRLAAEITEQYAHVASERAMVRLYTAEVLPQADLAFRSARANYAGGETDFVLVLESLRTFIDLRRSHIELLADAEMHLALLERATGLDLAGSALDVERALGVEEER